MGRARGGGKVGFRGKAKRTLSGPDHRSRGLMSSLLSLLYPFPVVMAAVGVFLFVLVLFLTRSYSVATSSLQLTI